MRLWHETLIPHLPRQQLLGQHRECCALRGNGWNKRHSVVNYVFEYPPEQLFLYHEAIMKEMENRGYNVDPLWKNAEYRGKKCDPFDREVFTKGKHIDKNVLFYPEHNEHYLQECIDNLLGKNIHINLDRDQHK